VLKIFVAITTSLALLLLVASPSLAAPLKSKSPSVSASVAKNRRSMSASFLNIKNVKKISYQLTYDSNKGPQGAGGTINVPKNKNSLSRTLLFGTCSKNVCTYHKNLKNIKLSADFTLKSGGVISYEKKLK